MNKEFLDKIYLKHQELTTYPPTSSMCKLITRALLVLFPEQSKKKFITHQDLEEKFTSIENDLGNILSILEDRLPSSPKDIAKEFIDRIPKVYDLLLTDIEAIMEGDPAAKSEYEIIRAYPGFYAIAFYRFAHELYALKVPLLPRIITEFAHSKTGIDIHPGAQIGPHFFIDHGTGIVIGETTQIGKGVKLYQGVTLGALSVDKSMASTKRHPTIEDNVVIYSNATILGGETTIGKNCIIGGNVWLTRSLAAETTVYHQAQIKVRNEKEEIDG